MKKTIIIVLFLLCIIFIIPYRAKAAIITACDTNKSADCIQLAVDSAHDNDTIVIAKGTYKGDYFSEFNEGQEQAHVTKCLVNLKGKKLTLKGEGNKESILFGEGHDRPYVEPIASRAGICSVGGEIVIDNLRIKEFQKRCAIFVNSQVTIKNSIIEGCDEGGITMIDGSTGLFVNNFFVATMGIMLQGKPDVKIINNTFFNSNIPYFIFDQIADAPKASIVNNIIVNEEFSIGIMNGNATQIERLSSSTFSNNIVWKNDKDCYPTEYCANFTGKITSDPLFIEPAVDQRGMAGWANFGFKEGSPAVGKGDPTIPGTKELGTSGGPCANPNDAICATFIQNNKPPVPQPMNINNQPPENNNPPGNNQGENNQRQNPFGIPIPLSRLIDIPNNISFSNPLSKETKSITAEDEMFGLFTYAALSITYMMIMNFALNMGSEFSVWFMGSFFILGAVIGGWFHNYEFGFVVGVVLSLLFIGGPKKEM